MKLRLQYQIGITVAIALCASCAGQADTYKLGEPTRTIPLPKELDHNFLAWVSADEIVFLQAVGDSLGQEKFSILSYTMSRDIWQELVMPRLGDCSNIQLRWLYRYGSDKILYLSDCNRIDPTGQYLIESRESINSVNLSRTNSQVLFAGSANFHITQFAYQPDGSGRLLLETLSHDFFETTPDGVLQQIDLGYEGLSGPAWSPDGQFLAFLATSDPSATTPPPWDLFVADSSYSGFRKMLSNIRTPAHVKWSINGDWIAFRGNYDGLDGVWALNLNSNKLVRVWPEQVSFDWSPEEDNQLVILDPSESNSSDPDDTGPSFVFVSINHDAEPSMQATP